MPNVKRSANPAAERQVFRNISVMIPPADDRQASPSFSDAVERLKAVHARLDDQVTSLTHIGNCFLGACPADERSANKASPAPDGSVNVLASQIGDIEDLVSALEGKIDRFRGRH